MSADTTINDTKPLEPDATPLSEHRLDRCSFVVTDDVEVSTPANGAPARLVKLTRGQIIHIVTFSQERGIFLRNGGDNFYVPLDAAGRILVRHE